MRALAAVTPYSLSLEPSTTIFVMDTDPGFKAALEEAQKGSDEGGVPIGAALVAADGTVLGRGHNLRIQKSSATLHAEISALENAGRLPAASYRGATMYTTLSPCDMCTGACVMYKVKRVVIGMPSHTAVMSRLIDHIRRKQDLCGRGGLSEAEGHRGRCASE